MRPLLDTVRIGPVGMLQAAEWQQDVILACVQFKVEAPECLEALDPCSDARFEYGDKLPIRGNGASHEPRFQGFADADPGKTLLEARSVSPDLDAHRLMWV